MVDANKKPNGKMADDILLHKRMFGRKSQMSWNLTHALKQCGG